MGQFWGRVVLRDNLPLHTAIRRDDIKTITDKVESGYDASKDDDEPPLCLACRIGNEKSVEALIQMENIDPEMEDKSGFTPLILAVYAGHLKIVKMLLLNSYVNVNKVSKSGATAFDVSIITGKYEIAEIIMDSPDFDMRISATKDVIDENLFLVQCRRLNREAIRLLIRAGCDIYSKDKDGRNCLWHLTLPPRRRGALAIIVQRVRGNDEESIREELFLTLTDCGVPVDRNTLENVAVTVPKLVPIAKEIMQNPQSLKQACRKEIWKSMKRSKFKNLSLGISSLRHSHLPAALTEYLLFDKYK